jgi:DNA helicase HerA-like ATPase
MQEIGTISGAVQPTAFNITLKDATVERGSYVKVKHDVYGWVLARIESLKRFLDDFDEEINVATARTVGYVKDGVVLIPKTPFRPEEKVYRADNNMITQIVGLRQTKSNSIYIGLLEGHNIPVYLDVKKFIGKHVSVLAKTGAGKSYTVAVILEELIKNDIPVVIIDPHGEYSSLGTENDDYDVMLKYNEKLPKNSEDRVASKSYAGKVVEYVSDPAINPSARHLVLNPVFDVMELTDIMPMALGDKQKSVLYGALRDLEGEKYTLDDLIKKVDEQPTTLKWKVISGLETLQESGVFSGNPISYTELVKPGQTSILNLKGTDPHIQELIVAKVAKDLFDLRAVDKIPELFFLVEEAHNFCPERGFGDALSSNVLRTIASEGRKFGFRLGVVSQRPARIDKNILSQCNTQIILKVTNPNDLRAISHSIEGFTSGMESEIRQLPVGHALVVGDCVEQPITVEIRVRETKHGVVKFKRPAEEDDEEEPPKRKAAPKPPSFWERLLNVFLRPKE